jgi:DNA-binding IclR family transcriptional regulator
MGKLENSVISVLESSDGGLTLSEIAERVEQTEKKTFKILRKLFQKGAIDTENRRYKLANR